MSIYSHDIFVFRSDCRGDDFDLADNPSPLPLALSPSPSPSRYPSPAYNNTTTSEYIDKRNIVIVLQHYWR